MNTKLIIITTILIIEGAVGAFTLINNQRAVSALQPEITTTEKLNGWKEKKEICIFIKIMKSRRTGYRTKIVYIFLRNYGKIGTCGLMINKNGIT